MSDISQLELAEQIARKAHEGQFRRDGVTPYIKHVEKVVSLVKGNNVQTVAWLHDVIEDSDHTVTSLCNLGVSVGIVRIVDILTHRKEWTYEQYIDEIMTEGVGIGMSVKVADIVANLSDSPTDKQIVKYYQALDMLCGCGNPDCQ